MLFYSTWLDASNNISAITTDFQQVIEINIKNGHKIVVLDFK